ncbi:MAG: hypothetical protein ACI8Z7_000561 [Candidatus Nanohaloarchaea archaeon]|jgi:hypothetical protein
MTVFETEDISMEEGMRRVRGNNGLMSYLEENPEIEKLIEKHVGRAVERSENSYPGFDRLVAELDRYEQGLSDEDYQETLRELENSLDGRYADGAGDIIISDVEHEEIPLELSVHRVREFEKMHRGGWNWPSDDKSHSGVVVQYLKREFTGGVN